MAKKKAGTTVNVIIAQPPAQSGPPAGSIPMGKPPMPPPMPPGGPPPVGMAGPPPGMPMRARGGAIKAGSGSALGRLHKAGKGC